jgi:RimJ/RimL family protein N-acetyltransferase
MELQLYGDGDMALTEAIECDPVVMAELGGPLPREAIPAIHRKRLPGAVKGTWWFKIIPEPGGQAAGTIGIWDSKYKGTPIVEMGWTVLPAFQRRGLAGAAARMILDRARAEKRCSSIHAFPGVTNAASNAICRKSGFVLIEECEVEYAGRMLKVNHWRVDLA